MARRCDHVQASLPRLLDGTLEDGRFGERRARRLMTHVDGCDACTAEHARAHLVEQGLTGLRLAESSSGGLPPEGLLESLLTQAGQRDLRARVAAPARGAISGARPALSVTFALVALVLLVGGGWAGWRLGRAAQERRTSRS